MPKEEVIKALQRTTDKEGNLVPVFPLTSADAVYYDVDKQITVKDKLDGGAITDKSASYNNIYNHYDMDGGIGAIKLNLPQIDNNTVDIDLTVSNGVKSNSFNTSRIYIPKLPRTPVVGTAVVREMSTDGTYIFLVIKRNQTYIAKLYKTGNSTVTELPFALKTISAPIRARFTKSNNKIIVFGNTSGGTGTFEVHNINATQGSYSSYVISNPLTYNDSTIGASTFFDTVLMNNTDYLVVNDPNTDATSLKSFIINNTSLVSTTAISTRNTFRIAGDIRISPDSMKLAFLTSSANAMYVMTRNTTSTGVFTAASNTLDIAYGWGGAYYGARVGTWSNISFTSDSSHIYGTYTVGYSTTFRSCDVRGTYGEYLSNNTFKEITMHTENTRFDIGLNVYRPIPKATAYGNTARTFDFLAVGSMSGSENIGRMIGPIVRCYTSGTPTQIALSYNSQSQNNIIESALAPMESELQWFDPDEDTPLSQWTFSDVLIHPTSGYAYAIFDIIRDVPMCSIYVGYNNPSYVTSANPSQIPIPSQIKFANISYDGNAIASVTGASSSTLGVIARGSTNNNFVRRVIPYTRSISNAVVGCKVTNGGNCVVCITQSGIEVFRWLNAAYVKVTPLGSVPSSFISTDAKVYMSNTVVDSTGKETWTMLRAEKIVEGNVQFTVIGFEYNGENCIVSPYTITQQVNTHKSVIGASFSPDGTRLAIICEDTDGDKIYLFEKSGSAYGLKQNISTITNGYYKTSPTTPKNNCALLSMTVSTSLLVYAGSSGGLSSYVIDWASNTATYRSIDILPSLFSTGMGYAYVTNRLLIASANNSIIYTLSFDGNNLSLIEAHEESGVYNSDLFINDDGTVALAPEAYGVYARMLHILPTPMSGKIKAIGTYTGDRWLNVSISTNNPDLHDTVKFAIDDGNPILLIGDTVTVWKPLSINIDKITISGETANRYSHRIGYSSVLIRDLSSITNITGNGVLYDDKLYTQRFKVKGYNIPYSSWVADPVGTLYRCRIPHEMITATSTVNISASDIESYRIMEYMGVLPLTVENSGYVEIYATFILNLQFNVDIEILT